MASEASERVQPDLTFGVIDEAKTASNMPDFSPMISSALMSFPTMAPTPPPTKPFCFEHTQSAKNPERWTLAVMFDGKSKTDQIKLLEDAERKRFVTLVSTDLKAAGWNDDNSEQLRLALDAAALAATAEPTQNKSKPQNKPDHWLADDALRTENILATKFVDQDHTVLRFVPPWGRWLAWDSKRWLRDERDCRVFGRVREFVDALWGDFGAIAKKLDRDDVGVVHSWVKKSNSEKVMQAVLKLAKSDKRVVIDVEQLNAEVGVLNVQNGILDLATGELSPHEPSRNITQLANVEYHADADCPQFKAALKLIFNDDAELIRYVQQLLGYAISGNCSAHILPIAYGSGCNGKSTITNIVLGLLGDYGALAHESLLLGNHTGHPTEKMHLYQKRFVPISEPSQGSQLKEARVKELTGDATITARGMCENFWSFNRTHTFWMSTNHLPSISGADEGIWRRIKLIPFTVDLRQKVTPEPDLDKRLIREEGPGILRWMCEGYRDFLAHGFVEPLCVITATDSYRTDEDELGRFIGERCWVSANGIATAEDLWKAYQQWHGTMTQTNFGREMANRFKKEKPTSGAYRRKTVYYGVALLSNAQSDKELEHENQEPF